MNLSFAFWGKNSSISGVKPLQITPYSYWYNHETISGFSALIPSMTSYTAPLGVASASVDSSSFFPAWGAFDNNTANTWESINNSSIVFNAPQWIQYQFSSSKVVKAYSFSSVYGTTNSIMINWSFLGSNDNFNWILLDNRSIPQSSTTFIMAGGFFQITNQTPYLYYRLLVNQNFIPIINPVLINKLQMYSHP